MPNLKPFKPDLFMLVGPNGSGKSSVLFESQIARELTFVNPDDIARREFVHISDPQTRNLLAWKECNAQRKALLLKKANCGFETVGSHPSKLQFIRDAHSLGYFVTVVFVATENPSINIQRIKNRVGKGGHGVPDEKVISRYHKTLSLLHDYYTLADCMTVWDNSIDATDPVSVSARKLLVKTGKETIITKYARDIIWVNEHLISKLE